MMFGSRVWLIASLPLMNALYAWLILFGLDHGFNLKPALIWGMAVNLVGGVMCILNARDK